MKLHGIRLLGPGWSPEERRYQILDRLPPDVSDMIEMAALDPDPSVIVYKLRMKKTPERTAYVDKHLSMAEDELIFEETGEPAPAELPTFH